MRYKFGPRIDATITRPAVAGELTDPSVDVTIDSVVAGDPGLVDVVLAVAVPAYDPSTTAHLIAIHGVAFGKSDGIPSDPQKVLAASNPAGSIDLTGQVSGVASTFTVHSVPEGAASILTVLVFDDTPATPDPSTPPVAPADPVATVPAPIAS